MFRRLGESLRRFMAGRYGSDQLNMALLVGAVVLSLLNGILTLALSFSTAYCHFISPLLSLAVYGLVIWATCRMLSRNLYKRQRENKRMMQLWTRLRDRNNRYFRCPACKQTVRVPKRRGKICIRCPKCGEKFIRKT